MDDMFKDRSERGPKFESTVAARTDQVNGKGLSRQSADRIEDGLLLMDPSFRTIAIEQGVESMLLGDRGSFGIKPTLLIPLEFQEAIRNARPSELPGMKMTLCLGKSEYKCRVFLLHCQDGVLPRHFFALHLTRSVDKFDRIARFSSAYHLTSREEQALRGIAEGLSSKELAEKMGINANTVKSFLRLIMIKLGVRRRGEVLAKLLNYDGNP